MSSIELLGLREYEGSTGADSITLSPGSGGQFSPSSLPSLVAWYDASNTSSITQSSGSVSQWNDLSGNGHHLTQATGANQPVTNSVTQNGLNVIHFNGTSSSMATAQFGANLGPPYTLFAVLILDSGVAFNFMTGVQIANQHGSFHDSRLFLPLTAGGPTGGTGCSIHQNDDFNSTGVSVSVNLFNAASAHVLGGRFTAAETLFAYEDGTEFGPSAALGGGTATVIINTLDLGWDGIHDWWPGSVAEVVFTSADMASSDRSNLQTYFKNKWATP